MFRTLKMLNAYRISTFVNLLIFFAQKIPFIGKKIKNEWYAKIGFKRGLAFIAYILKILWGFASKLLVVGLFMYYAAAIWNSNITLENQFQLFVHILFILIFVVSGISTATILEPKREKYIAVKLMRISPRSYMRTTMMYHYITYLIFYLPALLIFVPLLGGTILQVLQLVISLFLWKITCEYVHLKIYEKTKLVLIKNVPIVWLTITAGLILAYLPLLTNIIPPFGHVMLSWPVFVVICVIGIFAVFKLSTYTNYSEIVDAATKRDDPYLNLGKMMSDAHKDSVKTKDKDLELTIEVNPSDTKQDQLHGYAYLNTISNQRHRSLILLPVYKRLAGIGAVCVLGILFAIWDIESASSILSNATAFIPMLFLVMNFVAVGDKISRVYFYHCDLSMLRYSFYRNDTILHYKIRLKQLIGLNLLIGIAIGVTITLVMLIVGVGTIKELVQLWISLISISVFYSVHHLFMYYAVQPYSSEMNMKSPFFFVTNMLVSFFGALIVFTGIPLDLFTILILFITTLYMLISLIVVKRIGPRTFKVR